MPRTILALGGGAPNFTIMTGVLLALDEAGLKIDHLSMTGAGMVAGLLYIAPKGGEEKRREALENTMNLGISDPIYAGLPINYKIFQKSGRGADLMRQMMSRNPVMQRWLHQHGMTNGQKLISDWVQLMAAMASPGDMGWFSRGMCAHAPFIEEVVDFAALARSEIDCSIGAYCLDDNKPRTFEKKDIGPDTFRAALSFPFIYPPFKWRDGKYYIEGASFHALNLQEVIEDARDDDSKETITTVILVDILQPNLIRKPRTIWEAYSQSVITPIVGSARKELDQFKSWVQFNVDSGLNRARRTTIKDASGHERRSTMIMTEPYIDGSAKEIQEQLSKMRPSLFEVSVQIPSDRREDLMTWKKSNLEYLFNLGYFAGKEFAAEAQSMQRSDEFFEFRRKPTEATTPPAPGATGEAKVAPEAAGAGTRKARARSA